MDIALHDAQGMSGIQLYTRSEYRSSAETQKAICGEEVCELFLF